MIIQMNEPLPVNLKVGRAVLSPPGMAQNRRPSCGAVRTPRPTFAGRFRGSKRELVGGILSPSLSPSDGEREKNLRFAGRSANSHSSNRGRSFTLSLWEGKRTGVRVWRHGVNTAKEGL